MPIGDDFQDTTPAAVQRLHYPPPDGTGSFEWAAGQKLGTALTAALPASLKNRTLESDAQVTLTFDVKVAP